LPKAPSFRKRHRDEKFRRRTDELRPVVSRRDAAHIVPPTGTKGLNSAMFDAMLLARAFVEHYRGMRRISSAWRARLRTVGIETFINSQCVHALPSNITEVD
jgi:2-polyprenyl-6-methoxyphenol hydroxylase-like FAD-dependent oxidoreductase